MRHEKHFPVLPEFKRSPNNIRTCASVERVNSKESVPNVACSIRAASYAER